MQHVTCRTAFPWTTFSTMDPYDHHALKQRVTLSNFLWTNSTTHSRYIWSPLSTVLFTHPKTNTIVQSPDNYVLGQNRELLLNQNYCSKPSSHKNVLRLKITSKESIRLLLNESKTFVSNDCSQCDSSCAPSNKHRHRTNKI